jgi:acyl carrier protein
MGLDGVEFVMAVEEAFGLAIPDEDAQKLFTPGDIVQYLEARLSLGATACLEQRAFHALRRAGVGVLDRPRSAFRPSTPWDSVLPSGKRREAWKQLHQAVGVSPWPRSWVLGSLPRDQVTVGDTARYLATYAAAALQPPDGGWSRTQIEQIVTRLISEQLGINEFAWHARFVDDLGVD